MYKFSLLIGFILVSIATGFQPEKTFFAINPPAANSARNHSVSDLKTCLVSMVQRFTHSWAVTSCTAMENLTDKGEQPSVIIENNDLSHNNFAGIRIRGDMPLTIRKCNIYSNGTAGIDVDMQGQVKVTECSIFQNGRAGVNVDESTHTVIEKNKIYQNKRAGVRIWEGDQKALFVKVIDVKVADNRIYQNDFAGISSMPEPDLVRIDLAVVANDIYQNEIAGIRVKNNIRLTAQGNQIHDNTMAGIISHESFMPPELDIYQNKISFNNGPGIHVYNGITGPIGISNNWIFNNERSGILCGFWGEKISKSFVNVRILNNTIVSNGYFGQGAGIRNESQGEVVITNNIVAYNYVSGIRSRACSGYSYNLLFANGYVGNCCDDPDIAPFWVETLQYTGCPGRGKGDRIGDPLFVDPDNYNFNIQDDSPAIKSATSVYGLTNNGSIHNNDMGATGGPFAVK